MAITRETLFCSERIVEFSSDVKLENKLRSIVYVDARKSFLKETQVDFC